MNRLIGTTDVSGDLFAGKSIPRPDPVIKRKLAPELTNARMLCRRLRDEKARPDKKRIAHLICLNLLSMLRHGPQRI